MSTSRLFIHRIYTERRNSKAQILKHNIPSHHIHVVNYNIVYPIAEKPNNVQPNEFKSKTRLNKLEKREYKVNLDPISIKYII